MKRSERAILTTHVGSLPERVQPDLAAPDMEARLAEEVAFIVERQRAVGLDVINEGEYSKVGDWISYAEDRFEGFETDPLPGTPMVQRGKDREEFADFYTQDAERITRFAQSGATSRAKRPRYVCTGPIVYRGQAAVEREVALLKRALKPGEEAFLTATAPGSLEVYRRNVYYGSDEEYVFALADALAVEYRAIAEAGLLLQVDDAWLPGLWDRVGMAMGMDAFLAYSALRVEALNHALRGIPAEQVRYHMCWGSWKGPHAYDLELEHLVALLLKVNAGAYLIEAANARHEHEHAVWQTTRLPAGRILVPGVVTHSTDVVEHPDLVSERIQRFARAVGPENVIAGTDCGFGGRSHPQIAWAKLGSLVEGAKRATKALGLH